MKKFVTLLSVLLAFACFVVLADETIIKWTWEMNDPDVVAFRYQVNGQADDGWKIVGTNETSYSLRNVTPGDTYTLYLQQSYDRLRWSASSESSIIVPMATTAEAPQTPQTTATQSQQYSVQATEEVKETSTKEETAESTTTTPLTEDKNTQPTTPVEEK